MESLLQEVIFVGRGKFKHRIDHYYLELVNMDNELQRSSFTSSNLDYTSSSVGFTGWRKYFIAYSTVIFIIIACACILIMLQYNWAHWNHKLAAKIALLLSGLFPPIYLWFEFNWLWKNAPNDERPPLEVIKHSQEIARDLWIAFVGLITLLYFSD